MATLKTTLKIESTDLFPTPVNFTTVNNNTITANLSAFTSVTVTTAAVALATIPITGAWIYVSAPSGNLVNIILRIAGGADISIIKPGDVGLFPLCDTAAPFVLEADVASGTAFLNYYVGTR